MNVKRKFFGGLLALLFSASALAAGFATTDLHTLTPAELADELAGEGVTVSNASFTGHNAAGGIFSGGGDIVGIPSGVVLSSGNVNHVSGPNSDEEHSTRYGNPGDGDLSAVNGQSTTDAAVLEFDFVPAGDSVSLSFVFGSDEYPLFLPEEGPPSSDFNDVFAVYINGVNCALVPGSSDPVTINTVNNVTNSEFYVDNSLDGGAPHNTEMDGFTLVLDCLADVMPGVSNTMKLAIADGTPFEGDERLDDTVDSWALIQTASLTSVTEPPEPPVQGCKEDGLLLVRTTGIASRLVHTTVEPLLADLNDNLTGTGLEAVTEPLPEGVHNLNCDLVVPLEDAVDPVTDGLSKTLGDLTGL